MKITIFGEILWDIFGDERKIGGAPFNFAAHVLKEGSDVDLISAVGEDDLGNAALKACAQMNIPTENIARNFRPTGRALVTLDHGIPSYDLSGDMAYDHIPVPDALPAYDKYAEDFESKRCDDGSWEMQHETTAFYFGTLAQRGSVSRESLRKILALCRDEFDEIFFDINIRQDYYSDEIIEESLREATILKISREEIGVLGISGSPCDICRKLMDRYHKLKLIVVTLDSEGAFVIERSGRITSSRLPQCEVVSTVGAGDSFAAAFLVNYLNGKPLKVCLERATSLAERVCEHQEAIPVYPMDDIRKWKAIYRLLDKVSTEVFDCGQLCNSACCKNYGKPDDMGIYLLPGEHLILKESEKEGQWLQWEEQDPEEVDMPSSWTGPAYFVNCLTPPNCPRKWRPLQCRTFPLKPVIGDNGVLEMIWDDDELPYECPIIAHNMPVHDSFYKATYTVWTHLLRDPRILDLVLSWS